MPLSKIYFRADAGQEIGYGHFTRSLALASMLQDRFDCTFFTQTPTDYQKVEANEVCRLVELPSDDSKFNLFLNYLVGDEIIFLDNYFFTSDYQKKIKAKGCKLVCIGSNDRHYFADLVINTIITNKDEFSAEPYTKFCLGIEWTILRYPFINFNIEKRNPEEGRVVVCFGGTDPLMITENIINILKKAKKVKQISVIATSQFDENRLSSLREKGCFTYVNQTAKEIVSIFEKCEFAILSTSTIALEALSCGIPVIGGFYIDNQTRIYNFLVEKEYIVGLGNLQDNNIEENLLTILKNTKFNRNEDKTLNLKSLPNRYIKVFNRL